MDLIGIDSFINEMLFLSEREVYSYLRVFHIPDVGDMHVLVVVFVLC